jgi:hypothetical protein
LKKCRKIDDEASIIEKECGVFWGIKKYHGGCP